MELLVIGALAYAGNKLNKSEEKKTRKKKLADIRNTRRKNLF